MNTNEQALEGILRHFLKMCVADPRIGTSHIALYAGIIHLWGQNGKKNPLPAFNREIMKIAKIASTSTFTRLIADLQYGGYIKYESSFYKKVPSQITILKQE
jgi:hypothetical protein